MKNRWIHQPRVIPVHRQNFRRRNHARTKFAVLSLALGACAYWALAAHREVTEAASQLCK